MNYFTSALSVLLHFVFVIAISLFLVRLLLQWAGASFNNPISQFFYRASNPVLMPLRRALPTVNGFNIAAAVVAWLLASLEAWVLWALRGGLLNPAAALAFGLASALSLLLYIFMGLLILTILISLINPGADHAIARLAFQLTEPVLRPIRRRIPMLGPFDLSPLVVFLLIGLAHVLVVAPLNDLGAWLAQ